MLIRLVHQNAERKLLDQVENDAVGLKSALHFQCSKSGLRPDEDDIVTTIKPVLEQHDAAVYFLHDDDVVITWNGAQKTVLDSLCERLYQRFQLSTDKPLHMYYDFAAQGEELRRLCKHKLAARDEYDGALTWAAPSSAPQEKPPVLSLPAPTSKQLAIFKTKAKERGRRKPTEILIVEDQTFSRNLLAGLLDRTYKTFKAANATAAWVIYLEEAPDIVFLDIELPDISGHQLAAAIHAVDPSGQIIMVTANHYEKDVLEARKNGARGFIAKPYSKQKILSSIEQLIGKPKK